jgi:endonuclease III
VSPLHSPRATRAILAKLEVQHPNADTELHYRNAFELLVATILSAQSTDQRVNMITPALFAKYPDARALSAADPAEVERLVLQTGFFRQKTKAILGMARALVEKHGGEVPADIDTLVQLPGVGRKTANVVLGHALGVPGLPVDRHVLRVSNRIGLAEGDDPEALEARLCAALPRTQWTRASDTLILHGRRICRPSPLCDRCAVTDECVYYRRVIVPEAARAAARSRAGAKRAAKPARISAAAPSARSRGPRSRQR